eukprot:gene12681-biopygen13338
MSLVFGGRYLICNGPSAGNRRRRDSPLPRSRHRLQGPVRRRFSAGLPRRRLAGPPREHRRRADAKKGCAVITRQRREAGESPSRQRGHKGTHIAGRVARTAPGKFDARARPHVDRKEESMNLGPTSRGRLGAEERTRGAISGAAWS